PFTAYSSAEGNSSVLSAGTLSGICGKALQRGFFVRKFREDLVELRDFQNLFDSCRKADNFHGAAAFDHGQVVADELANSRTVEIVKPAQVEHNIFPFFGDETSDRLSQRSRFEGSKAARDIHQ